MASTGVSSLPAMMVLGLMIASGCGPRITVKDGTPPTVLFDPANSVIPTPNNLLLDDKGIVKIPPQCRELPLEKTVREEGLNRLDGFGTYKPPLQAQFSEKPDANSLKGRVFFTCRLPAPGGLSPCAEVGSDCDVEPCASCMFAVDEVVAPDLRDCRGSQKVFALTITPGDPLPPGGECGVVIADGVSTEAGRPFLPSATWYLVRQAAAPVELSGDTVIVNNTPIDSGDVAFLRSFADLWADHQPLLDHVEANGVARSATLLAWEFRPQTTTSPLDVAVPGSPAALSLAAPVVVRDLVDWRSDGDAANGDEIAAKYQDIFSSSAMYHPQFTNICDFIPCAATGSILEGSYTSPRFLQERDNPGGLPYPATDQWSDPMWPAVFDAAATVRFLAWFPDPVLRPPPSACGYPIVILGHGYGQVKELWPVLAAYLADVGIASIAIDSVNDGERAVQIDDSAAKLCSGQIDFVGNGACFENILPPNLAIGRDNVRQTALDEVRLAHVIAGDAIRTGCTGGAFCDSLRVDGARVGYAGGSMGCIIGTIVAAMSPDIRAAVLNAGGAAWVDVFRDSRDSSIHCGMVDALIQAGILEGVPWNGNDNSAALCFEESWKSDPKYKTFEMAARWLLDPADPANYAGKLGAENARVKVLLQEIVDDGTIPNPTTKELARLMGWSGDPMVSATAVSISDVHPTPAVCDAVAAGGNIFVDYISNAGTPANTFQHGNIVQVAYANDPSCQGARQVQTDAISFLAGALARVPAACSVAAPACP